MTKRISDLPPITSSLAGDELLEVSVPNLESSTGFTSRSVPSSAFMSGGSIPYRYSFQQNDLFLDGNTPQTFTQRFSLPILRDDALIINQSIEDTPRLVTAVLNFNFIAGFAYPESPYVSYEYSAIGMCNSSVWVNNLSSTDGDNAVMTTFDNSNDGTTSKLPFTITNYKYFSLLITPYNVEIINEGTFGESMDVTFAIARPYNGFINPERISFKGYMDATFLFMPFSEEPQPT